MLRHVVSWLRPRQREIPPPPTLAVSSMDAIQHLFGAARPSQPVDLPISVAAVEVTEATPLSTLPLDEPAQAAEIEERAVEPVSSIITGHPDDSDFRVPRDLSRAELPAECALIVGSCFSVIMQLYLPHGFPVTRVDHIAFNNAAVLPEETPSPLESYAFQLIMLPLRSALPEQLYFRLAYSDVAGYAAAFEVAREQLQQMLSSALAYRERRQFTTFVANFPTPQQNMAGRLLPRYDLRNPVYFVEMLNRVIADEISGMADVHLVDVDQISANFGRKYIQDDLVHLSNHGSIIADWEVEYDQHRLEKPTPLTSQHAFRVGEYFVAIAREIRGMYRTLRQADQVKMVIVDLDDTLWRGVVADEGLDRPLVVEGWPVAFVEALAFLKKRGILLAIVSKNDEARIRELWPHLYGSKLELSDFASIRINWQPKSQNVADILAEVNLLPRNVVFIDDNPVERANVEAAFPDIRTLGASLYQLRRIMLWSSETQVAYVTDESARRTEMIHAQAERETSRARLSRPDFLKTLEVHLRIFAVTDLSDPRFARSFELINKTNQFNTTGRRWSHETCQAAFMAGSVFWAFEVDDRFTQYGVVGVVIANQSHIEQLVMSCRVMGLDVELAAVAMVLRGMASDATAAMLPTDANAPCRNVYERCGFVAADGGWQLPDGASLQVPSHISLSTVTENVEVAL